MPGSLDSSVSGTGGTLDNSKPAVPEDCSIVDAQLTTFTTSKLTIPFNKITCVSVTKAQTAICAKKEAIIIAAGDECSAICVATGKVEFQMPYAFTLTAIRATVTTAPTTSGTLTVDVNEGGTSILSTKLTIDVGEKTSTSAATPAVISDTELADESIITIDVDAVSGGATEAGLKVYLIGYQT